MPEETALAGRVRSPGLPPIANSQDRAVPHSSSSMGVTSFSNCSAAVSCLINPDKVLASYFCSCPRMDKTRINFYPALLPLATIPTLMLPKSFDIGISMGYTSMPKEIPWAWAGEKRNYLVGSVCYTSVPLTYPCQIIVRFLRRLRQVTLVKWKLLAIQLNSYGSATNSR